MKIDDLSGILFYMVAFVVNKELVSEFIIIKNSVIMT
jgi:hypothetical protein